MTTTEIRPLMPPETAAEIAKAGAKAGDNEAFQAFGEDGFTFADFIDIINPLQHIPVVATIYRAMTGDDIDPGSRVAGGAASWSMKVNSVWSSFGQTRCSRPLFFMMSMRRM